MLPGEAEEVEAGNVADAAAMAQATVGAVDRQLDPGVVGPVARRPDHRVDLELAAVGEADRAPVGADRARPHRDAVALQHRAGSTRSGCRGPARAGRCGSRRSSRAARASSATRRGRGRAGAAAAASAGSRSRGEPRGCRPAPSRSGSRCCRRPRRARVLRAGPPGAGSRRCASGTTSAARPPAKAGTIGAWNGPVATTTASARIALPFASSTKPSASLLKRAHRRRELDRQLELFRVPLEIGSDLVTGRVPVRVAGEREPRQRVVAARGEQDERVPAIPPRGPDGVRRFEDHEPLLLFGQGMADRKPRLSGADDGDVVAHVVHDDPFLFGRGAGHLFDVRGVSGRWPARPGRS